MTSYRMAIWRRALVILTVLLVALLLVAPTASASSSQICPFFYGVRPGDTLSAIARRFGVTVTALTQANCICNPNLILVGQVLIIPCATGCCPAAGAPAAPSCAYIVRAGDTLTAIARRFGTTVKALQRLNGIANPNRILVGQRLNVCVDP